MKVALIALLCITAVLAEYTYDEGVVVLTDGTFDQAIKEFDFTLVEFYAPWCGHCKNLAPEYAKAAQQLAKTNPEVKLAKVDATVEKNAGAKFEIKGFPTIKFFTKGSNDPINYEGGRTAPDIVNWLKKKTGPASTHYQNLDSVQKGVTDNPVIGMYFGDASSEAYNNFMQAAQSFDDVSFGHSHDADAAKHYELNGDSVVLFKNFDEGKNVYSGNFAVQHIREWLNAHRHPTILPFDQKAAQRIFGEGLDSIFLIRGNDEKGAAAEEAFKTASKELKGKIVLSLAHIDEGLGGRLADYIGVSRDALPAIRVVQPGQNMKKYTFDQEITAENIINFVNDFKSGKTNPYFKSEDIPSDPYEDNVRILVGKNFKEVVLDSEDDVLMEFYAPWCGHCKSLAPIYSALAGRLKNVNGIVIGKMDSTANEVEGLSVQGFPTIKFYKKGRKNQPEDFNGERTEAGFIEYLRKHSSANIPPMDTDL